MSNTSFEKKTAYEAITGLLIGLIFLICPVFVFAVDHIYNTDYPLETDINDLNYNQSYEYGNDCGAYIVGQSFTANFTDAIGTITIWSGQFNSSTSSYLCVYDCGGACTNNLYFGQTFIACSDTSVPITTAYDFELTDFEFSPSIPIYEDHHYFMAVGGGGVKDCDIRAGTGGVRLATQGDNTLAYNSTSGIYFGSSYPTSNSYMKFTTGPSCTSDYCSFCLTGDDCISAGCAWEWLPSYERYECHTTWTPYVPGCGAGFQESCYGCYDQATCESAIPTGVCEWVDRGYGIACYPTEEVPEEAVWEAPELENCDELSGVEKWLCEIKNWLAGIFMPTQEKVNNLKMTIDNFKTKLPFNYAGALSAFFTTLKTSLDTEKAIPIKVLGVESNVSFSFWDQTTTIGGTSETFKNILYDFTTAVIIIAFIFWIISFIKRIF